MEHEHFVDGIGSAIDALEAAVVFLKNRENKDDRLTTISSAIDQNVAKLYQILAGADA